MTTRFADHLLDGDHASRPAATAVPVGTLYACSDHGLIYQSDGATWATWATLGAAATAAPERIVQNRRNLASDYTTASTTFADIDATNLTAALTTPAGGKRYLLTLQGRLNHTLSNGIGVLDFTVDGARIGSTSTTGLGVRLLSVPSGQSIGMDVTVVTDVLTAGAHAIVPQWRTSSGTLTLKTSASEFAQFTAIEL